MAPAQPSKPMKPIDKAPPLPVIPLRQGDNPYSDVGWNRDRTPMPTGNPFNDMVNKWIFRTPERAQDARNDAWETAYSGLRDIASGMSEPPAKSAKQLGLEGGEYPF